MLTLHDHLAQARERLVAAGIPPQEAALDAEVLARHVLGWDRARLLASRREPASAAFASDYSRAIARRAAHEPVAQITGLREFWGLEFEVTRDVLTPRPETELIVEEALAAFRNAPSPGSIVDVCTGSGCLAIVLALEFPAARVIATDVSEAALAVARRNAARHRVDDAITFVNGDLLDGITTPVDLIVSNPPYVPESDAPSLAPEVRDYEPAVALFGGADGMAVYRRLFPAAAAIARSDTSLIVEVGYDQYSAVTDLAAGSGWTVAHSRQDLQGITRTLIFVPAAPKPR